MLGALALLVSPMLRGAEEAPVTLVTDRVPLFTVMPDYPKNARRDRIEGEVQVCFEIARDGQTRRVSARRSTHRIFEKPSIRAVKDSTYVALNDDEVTSGIKQCRTFRFSLEPVVEEADN